MGALPPDPHYRLVLRTRHGAPPTTDPFRRLCLQHPSKINPSYGLDHHQVRGASGGRRVVAPPCPRSLARLQKSPISKCRYAALIRPYM